MRCQIGSHLRHCLFAGRGMGVCVFSTAGGVNVVKTGMLPSPNKKQQQLKNFIQAGTRQQSCTGFDNTGAPASLLLRSRNPSKDVVLVQGVRL